MASIFERLLRQDLLNLVFRAGSAPSITGPFLVSLHTADPGSTRANEVSAAVWTNYARVSVARTSAGFTSAADDGAGAGGGDKVTNVAVLDFGTATITGTAPVVGYVEIWDSATTPRRIGGLALTTPKTINNGDPVSFAVGALEFDLNG